MSLAIETAPLVGLIVVTLLLVLLEAGRKR